MKADLERYESYLEHKHPNRSTKKHYASDLSIFMQIVGDKSARELKVKDIDAFIKEQSQQQLKPATINRRLVAISGFLQFLIIEADEDGWRNPVKMKRHSIAQGEHHPRDVNEDTVAALWAMIEDPRDQAISP